MITSIYFQLYNETFTNLRIRQKDPCFLGAGRFYLVSHVKFDGARLYVSHEKKKKLRHVAQQLRFATNTLCGLSLLALTVCIMLMVVFNCEFYTNTFIEVSF